jgi:hypothetical protein
MLPANTARTKRESLRISSVERPGWLAGSGRIPEVGESVQSVEGPAEVVRICGRVGDGSRLLELRLFDRPKVPYFAASSNVLLRKDGSSDLLPPPGDPDPAATEAS